jgi:hypothetical protein
MINPLDVISRQIAGVHDQKTILFPYWESGRINQGGRHA